MYPYFQRKTIEKIIDLHIKNLLSFSQLCMVQHEYCKGRSVETALHEVVETLAAFLDIEDAFSNLKAFSIGNALREFGVEEY